MERKVRESCGKNVSRGDPAGAPRRLPPARVPGVEIIFIVYFASYPVTDFPLS
ncbi:hypothetical protein [Peribacillus frigoritolerans]|uniref:hypothetical protein n=1 Tax=Peribacillus frigoritolerans TaxID=450367 RepID=UPI0031D15B46